MASIPDSKSDSNSTSQPPPPPPPPPEYQCNICLDTARDAVVSQCGHLFCWPCLHRWLETRPDRQECPVCKSHVTKDKCTPIYSHGSDTTKDPRDKVPPRPQGRQERSQANQNPFGGAFGDMFGTGMTAGNTSFSFGLFPFGLFGGSFTFGGNNNQQQQQQRARPTFNGEPLREEETELVKNFFLWLALL